MTKPQFLDGYSEQVTTNCERVLVTLLRGLGPLRQSVFLVGGLTPRYLVKAKPPEIPPHAGTGDIDMVVDMAILANTDAYATLEKNLKRMGFERAENDNGTKVNWRWKAKLESGSVLVVEFLAFRKDGPVAVAKFEIGDEDETAEPRLLRQRQVPAHASDLLPRGWRRNLQALQQVEGEALRIGSSYAV